MSAAISKEATLNPVTVSPSSGAAPTLTRLLEMPLNSPGKPLAEVQAEEVVEAVVAPVEPTTTEKEEIVLTECEKETTLIEEKSEEPTETVCVQEVMEVESQQEVSTSEPIEQEIMAPEANDKTENEVSVESAKEPLQEESQEQPNKEKAVDKSFVKEEIEGMVSEVVNEVEVNLTETAEKPAEEAVAETTTTPIKTESVAEEPNREEEERKVKEELAESVDEKVEVKETKTAETEEPTKGVETTTPKLTRRPLRGIRGKKLSTQETEAATEEKIKPVEPGPVTRRTRKSTQAEDHELEATEESVEAPPPSTVGKKRTSLPPLYVSTSSPAPSSGIESIPNSPTSSVSTVT